MSRTRSFGRLLLGAGLMSALAGMLLGLDARNSQAQDQLIDGDGSGRWTCATPSSCTAGSFNCVVRCDDRGCVCSIG